MASAASKLKAKAKAKAGPADDTDDPNFIGTYYRLAQFPKKPVVMPADTELVERNKHHESQDGPAPAKSKPAVIRCIPGPPQEQLKIEQPTRYIPLEGVVIQHPDGTSETWAKGRIESEMHELRIVRLDGGMEEEARTVHKTQLVNMSFRVDKHLTPQEIKEHLATKPKIAFLGIRLCTGHLELQVMPSRPNPLPPLRPRWPTASAAVGSTAAAPAAPASAAPAASSTTASTAAATAPTAPAEVSLPVIVYNLQINTLSSPPPMPFPAPSSSPEDGLNEGEKPPPRMIFTPVDRMNYYHKASWEQVVNRLKGWEDERIRRGWTGWGWQGNRKLWFYLPILHEYHLKQPEEPYGPLLGPLEDDQEAVASAAVAKATQKGRKIAPLKASASASTSTATSAVASASATKDKGKGKASTSSPSPSRSTAKPKPSTSSTPIAALSTAVPDPLTLARPEYVTTAASRRERAEARAAASSEGGWGRGEGRSSRSRSTSPAKTLRGRSTSSSPTKSTANAASKGKGKGKAKQEDSDEEEWRTQGLEREAMDLGVGDAVASSASELPTLAVKEDDGDGFDLAAESSKKKQHHSATKYGDRKERGARRSKIQSRPVPKDEEEDIGLDTSATTAAAVTEEAEGGAAEHEVEEEHLAAVESQEKDPSRLRKAKRPKTADGAPVLSSPGPPATQATSKLSDGNNTASSPATTSSATARLPSFKKLAKAAPAPSAADVDQVDLKELERRAAAWDVQPAPAAPKDIKGKGKEEDLDTGMDLEEGKTTADEDVEVEQQLLRHQPQPPAQQAALRLSIKGSGSISSATASSELETKENTPVERMEVEPIDSASGLASAPAAPAGEDRKEKILEAATSGETIEELIRREDAWSFPELRNKRTAPEPQTAQGVNPSLSSSFTYTRPQEQRQPHLHQDPASTSVHRGAMPPRQSSRPASPREATMATAAQHPDTLFSPPAPAGEQQQQTSTAIAGPLQGGRVPEELHSQPRPHGVGAGGHERPPALPYQPAAVSHPVAASSQAHRTLPSGPAAWPRGSSFSTQHTRPPPAARGPLAGLVLPPQEQGGGRSEGYHDRGSWGRGQQFLRRQEPPEQRPARHRSQRGTPFFPSSTPPQPQPRHPQQQQQAVPLPSTSTQPRAPLHHSDSSRRPPSHQSPSLLQRIETPTQQMWLLHDPEWLHPSTTTSDGPRLPPPPFPRPFAHPAVGASSNYEPVQSLRPWGKGVLRP